MVERPKRVGPTLPGARSKGARVQVLVELDRTPDRQLLDELRDLAGFEKTRSIGDTILIGEADGDKLGQLRQAPAVRDVNESTTLRPHPRI